MSSDWFFVPPLRLEKEDRPRGSPPGSISQGNGYPMNLVGIILAAGRGTRLQALGLRLPKAMVRVAGRTLVEHQLRAFQRAGINHVFVSVGHHGDPLKSHIRELNVDLNVVFVENSRFESTNNFESLRLCLCAVENDVSAIVINGDVMVTQEHFLRLVEENFSDTDGAFLMDTQSWSEDAMKILVDRNGSISGMSKTISAEEARGVSTDTYRLSPRAIRELRGPCNSANKDTENEWVEAIIDRKVRSGDLAFSTVGSTESWSEIDTPEDLFRASIHFSVAAITSGKFTNYLFDLDGTLVRKTQPIGQSPRTLKLLASRGATIAVASNNTSETSDEIQNKLRSLNFPDSLTVHTPLSHVRSWLKSHGHRFIYSLLNQSVDDWFVSNGFEISAEKAEVVVVGYSTEFDYAKLARVCELVNSGIPYVLTHSDISYPSKSGPIPDAGSFSSLITHVTGVLPSETFGKPDPQTFSRAIGADAKDTLMVGDRLATDMRLGRALGVKTALILPEPPEDVKEWFEIFRLVDYLLPSVDSILDS